MIAQLHGRVVALEPDAVVLDVNGIGFRVHVPTSLLADLGPEGATVTLHTQLVIRENEWLVIGAADRDAIDLFGLLLTVSGVGPRVALALLSMSDPASLRRAIADGDVATLTRAPGVGRRLAERVVVELRGKVEPGDRGLALGPLTGAQADALDALVALGYSQGEARRALAAAQASLPEGADIEERIMAALRSLSE